MAEPITEHDAKIELQKAAGAAWVIDPQAARLLVDNASGRRLLGAGPALDAAMPAVARLRLIAELDSAPDAPTTLLFWTPTGARSIRCRVAQVASAAGRRWLLVEAVDAGLGGGRNVTVDGDPRPMDDAEILREIGRRIREGQKLLAGKDGADVTPASSNAAKLKVAEPDAAASETTGSGRTALPRSNAPAAPAPAPAPAVSKDDLAKLAHELKTPLSAIVAAAEIMRDERLGKLNNERYRGYAADIYASASHATRIIERILTSGPSAESARDFNFLPIDVNAIAASCVSSMTPIADTAGVALASELSPQKLSLTVDETSLRQILLNLLTNAVKFARKGDHVTLVTRRDDSGAMVIQVRDTGPGMSRHQIARAAKATTKPQQGRSHQGGGLGIGLPLVRLLVEANGGTLKIDSKKGKGTTVTLVFSRNRRIAD